MSGINEDTPESRWTKKALIESEKRYRRLLDNSPDIIFRMSLPDRKFEYVSPAAEQLTGYTPEDFYSQSGLLEKIIHPDWQEYSKNEWKALLEGDAPPFYEYQVNDRAGKTLWFHQNNMLVRDECGHLEAIEGIITDITGRKRAEEALRKSEEKYRDIFENSVLGLFQTSPDGQLINANNALALMYGFSGATELLTSDLDVWNPPYANLEDRQELLQILAKMGKVENFETQNLKRDGSRFWVSITARAIRDTGGTVLFYEGTTIDITGRKRGEEALRESENRLRRFYESGLFGVIIWNMDGKITDANDKFLEMVGYTREDLEAGLINGFTLTPPEFAYIDDYSVAELKASGVNKVAFEKEYIRKDGTRIPVIMAGTMLDEKRFEGVAFVLDITIRKEAVAALRQSNRQLNLLSVITRHDILDKIMAILGYLSLAEMELKNPVVADYLSNIESATRAIQSQIEFTNVYENLGTHEPQWQDLDIIIALSSHLPSTIRLNTDLKSIGVYADPMLERVFFNLLDNSIRHGEQLTEIRVSSCLSDDVLTIIWEDNGVGIPVEDKEKIFERGFGKNTGLGLFLSREILSITGITITENGEPGKGARFEMTVPKGMWR